ncbi:MAG: type 4a pilus biogenesis protein PilO [Phycisphaeraceae bacterium]|nr:type 4a pilus biogenesis protein PilO [Phycisphaerales bacterium]MCB9860066.1 type 4a pilus biogenesis protein PilO [Phycisphaeraceae bacterium]
MKLGIREFLLLAALLAIPIASYWLVFRPQNREIRQAQNEISHKVEMLEKLRQATARSADLAEENENIKESIAAIEGRLPTHKEIDGVVRQVSDVAVESGLSQPQITTEKPIKAALYMEQPLTMVVEGSFRGFYDFLLRLEQLPRITRMPTMKVKRVDAYDGHMKAEFTLSIYFQQTEQVGG